MKLQCQKTGLISVSQVIELQLLSVFHFLVLCQGTGPLLFFFQSHFPTCLAHLCLHLDRDEDSNSVVRILPRSKYIPQNILGHLEKNSHLCVSLNLKQAHLAKNYMLRIICDSRNLWIQYRLLSFAFTTVGRLSNLLAY